MLWAGRPWRSQWGYTSTLRPSASKAILQSLNNLLNKLVLQIITSIPVLNVALQENGVWNVHSAHSYETTFRGKQGYIDDANFFLCNHKETFWTGPTKFVNGCRANAGRNILVEARLGCVMLNNSEIEALPHPQRQDTSHTLTTRLYHTLPTLEMMVKVSWIMLNIINQSLLYIRWGSRGSGNYRAEIKIQRWFRSKPNQCKSQRRVTTANFAMPASWINSSSSILSRERSGKDFLGIGLLENFFFVILR